MSSSFGLSWHTVLTDITLLTVTPFMFMSLHSQANVLVRESEIGYPGISEKHMYTFSYFSI